MIQGVCAEKGDVKVSFMHPKGPWLSWKQLLLNADNRKIAIYYYLIRIQTLSQRILKLCKNIQNLIIRYLDNHWISMEKIGSEIFIPRLARLHCGIFNFLSYSIEIQWLSRYRIMRFWIFLHSLRILWDRVCILMR